MKKTILILFISFYFIPTAYSQDTIYFDSKWKKCTKQESVFYREIVKQDKNYQIIDHYTSGQIQMKGFSSTKDSLNKIGKFEYYTKEGTLDAIENYKNNQQEGKYTEYYPNGAIKEIGQYKNDKLTGENIQYFENGLVRREAHLENGKYEGKMVYYNKKGEKIGEGNCKNDGWDGKWIRYENGNESIEFYGSEFKIEESRLKFISNKYVWTFYEKKDYGNYYDYCLRCISTKEDRKNHINKPPEIFFKFSKTDDMSKTDSLFNTFYKGYVSKEDYPISLADTNLRITDSYKLKYEKNNGDKYYLIILKIQRGDTYFMVQSKINADDYNSKEAMMLDLVKNISSY